MKEDRMDKAIAARKELYALISRCYEAGAAKPEENLTEHVEVLWEYIGELLQEAIQANKKISEEDAGRCTKK